MQDVETAIVQDDLEFKMVEELNRRKEEESLQDPKITDLSQQDRINYYIRYISSKKAV